MTTDENPHVASGEDFAQLLQRIKDHYAVSDSEIARRTGVHVSTVNTWVHRKRVPRRDAIEALAQAFPLFSASVLTVAAGRKAPGPLAPGTEERLLELFRGLTKEQQEIKELELKALVEHNERGGH